MHAAVTFIIFNIMKKETKSNEARKQLKEWKQKKKAASKTTLGNIPLKVTFKEAPATKQHVLERMQCFFK